MATALPALALIHRSAWNRNSANFAFTEFSEVRNSLATPSNSKNHSFGGGSIPTTRVWCIHYVLRGRHVKVQDSYLPSS
jgi:hypothetical protein